MSIADGFDHEKETATGASFVDKFAKALRVPPCTPAQFSEQLKQREVRAKSKGVDLFTSGKDQPFVLEKYCQAFAELINAEKFNYGKMNWGDDDAAKFADVLAECKGLKETWPALI